MSPERRRVLLALVSIFALASLVYANSLANGFALDDVWELWIILAERTLYLPSVGLAMAIVPVVQWLHGRSPRWRPAGVGIALVLILAAARTWTANSSGIRVW